MTTTEAGETSVSGVSSSTGFTRTLGPGSRVLPNLSPLTDRSKLSATPQLENVAAGLNAFGYDCGYDHGLIQVTHPSESPRPANAPGLLSIDSFMGGLSRLRTQSSFRPRLTSSLTFSKAPSAASPRLGDRPRTSGGVVPTPAGAAPLSRPGTSCGSVRFNRLAQSVDSLQALKVGGSTNLLPTNLLALTEPSYGKAEYAAASPSQQRAAPPPPPPPVDVSGPSRQPDAGSGEVASPSAQPQAGPAAGAASSPAGLRPSTPLVHLHDDASAALRSAHGRPVTPGVQGQTGLGRPLTTQSGRMRVATARPRTSHAMQGFKPSRGQALIVFQDLDRDKNGKVTMAELEDAALSLGFTLEQSRRMFDKLDCAKKGYLVAGDWGRREVMQLVEFFSHMYMVRFLGLPGPTATPEQVRKYAALQQLKAQRTLPAAINMARLNAVARGAHASTGSGNVIYDAFNFIDTDHNGTLSFDELRDGFYALGVYLTDDVLGDMMRFFDNSGDGRVDYYEFVQKMFPNRARA